MQKNAGQERQSTLKDWEVFFGRRGLSEVFLAKYISYCERLISNRVPVIFEFDHLSQLLGITPDYLAVAVNATKSCYRTFTIPKRSGGVREIEAPYPALLSCQKWIKAHILDKVPTHECAHGFVRKRSIITNAKPYLAKNDLLKMDLANFFPSIPIKRVITVFRNLGYAPNVAFYLASLCCVDGRMPQGAATSPALSNIIALRMDRRLAALSNVYSLSYTRYADDLTFSGKHIPLNFITLINAVATESGFDVRKDKTSLISGKGKRIVTGISVVGKHPKVPRAMKREIRKEVHFIQKFGLVSHGSKTRIRKPYYLQSLLGRIEFWRAVEPDNLFPANASLLIRQLISGA